MRIRGVFALVVLSFLIVSGLSVAGPINDTGDFAEITDRFDMLHDDIVTIPGIKDSTSLVCELTGLDFLSGQCLADVTGESRVLRNDAGITVVLNTTGFERQEAVTLWWVVVDPTTFAVNLTFAGGRITGGNGWANFAAHLNAGETVFDPAGNPWTFADPLNAIVALVVRSHGPKIPGQVDEQISTYNGGCNPGDPNEGLCVDRQGSVHLP